MGDSGKRLQDALRSASRRLTSRRRLILQVLEESEGHLDMVVMALSLGLLR